MAEGELKMEGLESITEMMKALTEVLTIVGLFNEIKKNCGEIPK